MSPQVLIGSPIRQKPAILREFLASLDRLDAKTPGLSFYFIDDNEQNLSREILREFALKKGERCKIYPTKIQNDRYTCDEITHRWKESMLWKMAAFKDQMIREARDQEVDYLFFIDSDLVLHSSVLDRLISAEKEIIANIFWTKWAPDSKFLPQVWLSDFYTLFEHGMQEPVSKTEAERREKIFLDRLKKPGIYEVGGLGACTLIARSALQKPISFQRIKNISFWGEDRHFCIRASALGISLFVDTHDPAYHIYRDSDLPGVQEFIQHETIST